jgi:NAD(P)-dependent dehydrogenase (short-subunit alcohol dehydrogenase family)
MPVIEFVGVAGAGKTTLARSCALALARRGHSVLLGRPSMRFPREQEEAPKTVSRLQKAWWMARGLASHAVRPSYLWDATGTISHMPYPAAVSFMSALFAHGFPAAYGAEQRCDIVLVDQGMLQTLAHALTMSRITDEQFRRCVAHVLRYRLCGNVIIFLLCKQTILLHRIRSSTKHLGQKEDLDIHAYVHNACLSTDILINEIPSSARLVIESGDDTDSGLLGEVLASSIMDRSKFGVGKHSKGLRSSLPAEPP